MKSDYLVVNYVVSPVLVTPTLIQARASFCHLQRMRNLHCKMATTIVLRFQKKCIIVATANKVKYDLIFFYTFKINIFFLNYSIFLTENLSYLQGNSERIII